MTTRKQTNLRLPSNLDIRALGCNWLQAERIAKIIRVLHEKGPLDTIELRNEIDEEFEAVVRLLTRKQVAHLYHRLRRYRKCSLWELRREAVAAVKPAKIPKCRRTLPSSNDFRAKGLTRGQANLGEKIVQILDGDGELPADELARKCGRPGRNVVFTYTLQRLTAHKLIHHTERRYIIPKSEGGPRNPRSLPDLLALNAANVDKFPRVQLKSKLQIRPSSNPQPFSRAVDGVDWDAVTSGRAKRRLIEAIGPARKITACTLAGAARVGFPSSFYKHMNWLKAKGLVTWPGSDTRGSRAGILYKTRQQNFGKLPQLADDAVPVPSDDDQPATWFGEARIGWDAFDASTRELIERFD